MHNVRDICRHQIEKGKYIGRKKTVIKEQGEEGKIPILSENETVRRRKLPDVTLADQNTSVVDGLGKTKLEHLGLEAALQKVLDLFKNKKQDNKDEIV